jgi:hypothetical protein
VTPTFRENTRQMKSGMEELSFNHLIPLELFHEIHLFSNDRDYYKLITSMKSFSEVKFRTRKMRLKDHEAMRFLEDREFQQLILSKIASPAMQLSLLLKSFPEEVSSRDVLSSTPMQRLQILLQQSKQINLMKLQPEFADTAVWERFLKNKQNIHISYAIFMTIFPHLAFTHSLYINGNDQLTDLGSLSHMKKVSLSHCDVISDVSCLKSVEYLKLNLAVNRRCECTGKHSSSGNHPLLRNHGCFGSHPQHIS